MAGRADLAKVPEKLVEDAGIESVAEQQGLEALKSAVHQKQVRLIHSSDFQDSGFHREVLLQDLEQGNQVFWEWWNRFELKAKKMPIIFEWQIEVT